MIHPTFCRSCSPQLSFALRSDCCNVYIRQKKKKTNNKNGSSKKEREIEHQANGESLMKFSLSCPRFACALRPPILERERTFLSFFLSLVSSSLRIYDNFLSPLSPVPILFFSSVPTTEKSVTSFETENQIGAFKAPARSPPPGNLMQ